MLRIKICGITRLEDARLACKLGADAIGFIFYKKSPRWITLKAAVVIAEQLPEHVARVGVFVKTPWEEILRYVEQVRLNAVQFHGDYGLSEITRFPKEQVIAVARVSDTFQVADLEAFREHAAAILLDTHKKGVYGGTGETFDWQTAVDAKVYNRIILAGGLNPENVQKAVDTVSPYAIDVSSGVEAEPGKKEHQKLEQLFERVRKYRYEWKPDPNNHFPLA